MNGTKILDQVEITLVDKNKDNKHTVYLDIYDNSLSYKWLQALNHLLKNDYHLEKNYCFFGFADGPRNGEYLIKQINNSIGAINQADLGYRIDDVFTLENTIDSTYRIQQDKFNPSAAPHSIKNPFCLSEKYLLCRN